MRIVKPGTDDHINYLKSVLRRIRLNDPKIISLIKSEIGIKYGENNPEVVSKEIIRRLKIQNGKLLERVGRLKEQLRTMKTHKEKALLRDEKSQKLLKKVAEALGSCPACWGNSESCKRCEGNGIPGWKKINRRLFNTYVLPALEELYGLEFK